MTGWLLGDASARCVSPWPRGPANAVVSLVLAFHPGWVTLRGPSACDDPSRDQTVVPAGRFLGSSTYLHHGERVVAGQRLMQAATDIFLGWQRIKGLDGMTRDYYVRQFHDWKGGADVEQITIPGATQYARICGATLARAHARWGDRIAIASYLGQRDMFDRAIAEFSAAYADQNERDYQAFTAAVNSGRLIAQTGV